MGVGTAGSRGIHPRVLRGLLIAFLLGANLFVLVFTGISLYRSREEHQLRGDTLGRNIVEAMDQSLSNSVDKIDLALQAVADELERQLAAGGIDARATDRLLEKYQQRLPEVEAIRIANADGRVIFGRGLNPGEAVTWADRDYFIHLRNHPDAGLQFAKPRMGKVAKKYIVTFARRYNRPDGSFGGIVTAPIALDYFSGLLSRFEVGPNASLVLRDEDFGLIVRHPAIVNGAVGVVGNGDVSPELRQLVRSGVAVATYYAFGSDRVERSISFRWARRAPIMVLVGVAQEDILAEWKEEAFRGAASVLVFALLSLACGWVILYLMDRSLREGTRNALFLHHAGDGIHILDQDGHVIQASDQFCRLLGYGREEALGMHASRWDPRWSGGTTVDEDKPVVVETRYRRKDGTPVDVEVQLARFELEGESYLFASARDIGDKKRQQEALAESEAKLRQSEERYRLLLKNSPVGILHYDTDLVVTFSNDRFEDIMGVPRGYMLGLDCKNLKDQAAVPAMAQALAGEPGHYEGPYVTTYGQVRLWISMHCAPLVTDQGAILGGIAIVEDVTARKRIEDVEQRQREGLAHLNEIAAFSHLPLGEQFHQALAIGTRYLGLEYGIVSQVADDRYRIVAQASPPDTLRDGQVFDFGITYCQLTLEEEKVVAIADMGRSPHLGHPCYQAFKLEAYIGAPIFVGGKVYGTVNFSSPRPYQRAFDEGDREFMSLLARWVGSAIQRDQAEKGLAASEARLKAIIENEPECVKVLGPGGRLLQMNRAGLDFLEVDSVEEANALGLANFISPEHREAFRDLSERVFRGESGSLEFLVRGRKGRRRWLDTRAAPLRDAQGRVEALLGVTRDITARKEADSQLRLAASVFTHAHEGIVICNAERMIVEVNPTFSEITGYSREEILGRDPGFLASGRHGSDYYRAMWLALEKEGHWQGEIWNRRKDGSIYVERLTISTVRDDQERLTHYIGTFYDITPFKEQQEQLEQLAHYDALTHLPNRALLSDRMALALAQSRRSGNLVAVCYLDLDGFKAINDELGHDAGDILLVEVARRLKDTVRAGDTVARLGGDEFVILLIGIASAEEGERGAARILRALAAPVFIKGEERRISGSLGITLFPDDGNDADTLLRHADQAMYQAKQAGKNRYQLFDTRQDHRARDRQALRQRLGEGLAAGEFQLLYQPIVDMRKGHVLAVEGLVRWNHPQRGQLLPAEFLPETEGTDLEAALGRWVLAEGVGQLAAWRDMGLGHRLCLNISAGHLLDPDFVPELAQVLARYPILEPHALEIEILETAAIGDLEAAIAVFRRCRELGVDVALDDFGSGHSSLSYFRRLPVDTLKIDQVFVQSLLGDVEDLAIVESVVSLTRAFNRRLVAEGVESVEIGMLLLNLGCAIGQGYGIARPMAAANLPAWIAGYVPDPEWAFPATPFSREDLPLQVAELEHRAWYRRLEAWLREEPAAAPPPLDSHACRFGQWQAAAGQERYGRFPAFQALVEIHEAIHRLARELVQLQADGRREEAQAGLAEVQSLREKLIEQVGTLQADVLLERL